MASIAAFRKKWKSIKLVDLTADIISENTDKVIEANKMQLMAGLNNRGEFLSPKYSEDPWFKKPGAAQRYAQWKKKLFPEDDRPVDVPNLTITGRYYNGIRVRVSGDTVRYNNATLFANDIDRKYNNTVLGLNDKSKGSMWNTVVCPELIKKVNEIIGK